MYKETPLETADVWKKCKQNRLLYLWFKAICHYHSTIGPPYKKSIFLNYFISTIYMYFIVTSFIQITHTCPKVFPADLLLKTVLKKYSLSKKLKFHS